MNVVITIGCEHGSGGRHMEKIMAEKLGVESMAQRRRYVRRRCR